MFKGVPSFFFRGESPACHIVCLAASVAVRTFFLRSRSGFLFVLFQHSGKDCITVVGGQYPIRFRLEVFDFQLAVDDESQRGGLDPSDAQHLASLCVFQRVEPRGVHAQSPVTDGAAQSGFVERLVFALVFQVAESFTDGFFRE